MTVTQAAAVTRLLAERRDAIEILAISNPSRRNAPGPAAHRWLGGAVSARRSDQESKPA